MTSAAPKLRRGTIADVEAAPPDKVAELIDGVLHVMSRPAPPHAYAAGRIFLTLGSLFGSDDGDGPGGWWILLEPEIRFPCPTAPGELDIVVPDIAGWRVERMPEFPREAYHTLAPDWICEVLSKS